VNCRILLFSDTVCDANGVSRFLQNYSQLAKELKVDFRVVTSTTKTRCDDSLFFNTKPLFKIEMPFYKELDLVIPKKSELEKIVREFRPDLIHISTPGLVGFAGRKIAKKFGIPMAGVYHTDFPEFIYDNTKSSLLRWITKRVLRNFYKDFTAVFSRSETYIPHISESIGVLKEKIHVLKAGIDTNSFHTKFTDEVIWEKFKISKNSIKALYVGRLTPEKNFPFLLEVWKEFKNRSGDKTSSLIVVGDGKEKFGNLSQFGIHFLGYRGGEELSKIYASSDFFLFPSINDTLGQSVMEAQSSGLPAIVSNIGGPKTVVKNNESAFVLPIEKNIWIEKISKLIENQKLRKDFSKVGHQNIQNMSIKDSFLDFFQKSCYIKN
jgi:glycosyltransferase involved in cell wall biosynthesis